MTDFKRRDDSARRQNEVALRAIKLKYRSLVETTDTGYVILDDQGLVLDANQEYVRLTGRNALAEVIGQSVLEWTAPYDQARNAEEVRKCIEKGFVRNLEIDYLSPAGKITPIEINATIHRAGGKMTILGLCRDISARKQVEKKLQQSEATARTLLNIPTAAAFLLDRQGICLDANETLARRFGKPVSAIVGACIWDLFPPEVSQRRKAHFEGVLREKKMVRLEDERQGMVNDSIIAPILDDSGEVVRVAVMGFDITQRKRMENALREGEEQLRTISNNLANGMIYQLVRLHDGTRKFTYLSEKVRAFYGISPQEGMADASLVYGRVHEDDRTRVFWEEEQANKTMSVFKSEARMIDPRGAIRWSYFVSRPTQMADGATCWNGIEFDITERKKAEEEKEKLLAQLLQAQKMESVGRLAGGVAHDFNNMLGVILGCAELVQQNIIPGDPIAKTIEEIINAANRSADLTRQLLAFARKQTISPKVLDVNDTVSGMLKMLRRLLGEEIALLWLPGPSVWPVRIDPSQIDQILANLCVNARDAIDGTGTITIKTGNFTFESAAEGAATDMIPGEYVLLSVSDDGCGMEQEVLRNIFEPFFTTKGLGKGTGLGLSTVYGIVMQNAGYIDVDSRPGSGATITIFLPRYIDKSVPVSDLVQADAVLGGPETVLFVEDQPMMLDVGTRMLEALGYRVLPAGTSAEAIRLAREHAGEIQLLMTDVVMPEMNGRDLAKRLLSLYPNLIRLFMSGYTADVIAPHGVLEEGVHFIQKPFSMKELAVVVRAALDAK